MSMRLPIILSVVAAFLLTILVLPACCPLSTPDSRFQAEFVWNKYSEITPGYGIRVAFPSWLAPADRTKVLRAVDRYAHGVEERYPWAKENFVFSEYVVWIHDSPGGFAAGIPSSPVWARGWQIGKYCIVAWGHARDEDGKPVGISETDILPALPHEWFHAIFQEQYACGDPGHFLYFPLSIVCRAILGARIDVASSPIDLTRETKLHAKLYRYHPWAVPNSRE